LPFQHEIAIELGFAASSVTTSAHGPSRHFAAAQQISRFRKEADIKWRAGLAGSVANDPERTAVLISGANEMDSSNGNATANSMPSVLRVRPV
jgi:hypothetical protein